MLVLEKSKQAAESADYLDHLEISRHFVAIAFIPRRYCKFMSNSAFWDTTFLCSSCANGF